MTSNRNDGTLELETDLPQAELLETLRQWGPWRHNIRFSNGVSTSQLTTAEPYTDRPVGKLARLAGHIPLERLRGGDALDIGCNAGYNSIHLAQEYGMRVTGVDVVARHVEVARFLAGFLTNGSLELVLSDVTFFVRERRFDLVLHLGTLYHLPNPILSIENAWKSLKPGGYLGLETTCFNGDDPRLCMWIKGINNDATNRWAFSRPVLEEILESYGFQGIHLLHETELKQPWATGTGLSRVLYAARK